MEIALVHLLGYLTEKQWLDALANAAGNYSRQQIQEYAKIMDNNYSLGWSDKTRKKLNLDV